jgi:hypothetical protein
MFFITGINVTAMKPSNGTEPAFISINVKPPLSETSCSNVEVLLADGKRILFHQAVSSDFLKAVISYAMLHLSAACRYYLYSANTNMRKGFDSLCGIIASQMKQSALSGAVFIFFNKKHNQVKLLLWRGMALQCIISGWNKAPMTYLLLITTTQLFLSAVSNCNSYFRASH